MRNAQCSACRQMQGETSNKQLTNKGQAVAPSLVHPRVKRYPLVKTIISAPLSSKEIPSGQKPFPLQLSSIAVSRQGGEGSKMFNLQLS